MSASTLVLDPPPAPQPDLLQRLAEIRLCRKNFWYFASKHCLIYDPSGEWIPFHLWPAQANLAVSMQRNKLLVILKARQLGVTWLALAFALWLLLFHSAATVLLFSRRDTEAIDLLSRLRDMYKRLPDYLRVEASPGLDDNDHAWELSNGSRCLAFPTTAGDSYSATCAIVDEADLVPNFGRLMAAVKPTIDGGGRMILLSRADKTTPMSEFKTTYRKAKEPGKTPWVPVFLPWSARPTRDQKWYKEQHAEILARTGSLDALYEQYPATDVEALAPAELDKRLAPLWLQNCYVAMDIATDLIDKKMPAIPGLLIWRCPKPTDRFVIGADPAEGNPKSDDSSFVVLDIKTGEQVGELSGKFEPAVFGGYIDTVGKYFNDAQVLIERNNHGHAVILWMRDNSKLKLICGEDGKAGWFTSTKSRSVRWDEAAEQFRNGETIVHSFASLIELQSIEGATLKAPEGCADNRADAYSLACVAVTRGVKVMSKPPAAVNKGAAGIGMA